MYLKKLEIIGFKSFAGKYVLELEPGVVGIVGPNGSGKSNVADALRWVLGEQSYKLLRAKKSEDVIFAGSAKKAKGSYAEVSLLFDNSDGKAPIDFEELVVARRLYRNGENEYLINGRKVRLYDIQEILARSGFGRSSYSIIGQGTVDQLLFLNAEERRVFFSEAVGIKQFELQKDQALKKLQATEQNLIRAQDIVTELEPRLKLLKAQFKKAEARAEIQEELTELQSKYYASSWQEVAERLDAKKGSFSEITAEAQTVKAEIEAVNKELDQKIRFQQQRIESLRDLRIDLEGKVAEREAARTREVQVLGQLEIKKALAGLNLDNFGAELAALEEQSSQAKDRIAGYSQSIESKLTQVGEVENQIRELGMIIRQNEDERSGNIRRLRKQIETESSEKDRLRNREMQVSGQLEAKKALAGLDVERYAGEIAALEEKKKGLIQEIRALSEKLADNTGDIGKAEEEVASANAQIKALEAKIGELKKRSGFDQASFSEDFNSLYEEFLSFAGQLAVISDASKLEEAKTALAALKEKMDRLIGQVKPEKSEGFRLMAEAEREIDAHAIAKKDAYERLEGLRSASVSLRSEISVKQSEERQATKNIEEFRTRSLQVAEAGREISGLEETLMALRGEIEAKETSIYALKAEAAAAEAGEVNREENEKRRNLYSQADSLKSEISRERMDCQIKEGELRNIEREIAVLKSRIENSREASEEAGRLQEQLSVIREEIKQKEAEAEQSREALNKAEQDNSGSQETGELAGRIRQKQQLLGEIESQISVLNVEIAKIEARKDDLEQDIRKDLGPGFVEKMENGELKAVVLPRDVLAQLEGKIDRLKVKVMSIGDIDPLVKEEYKEVEERYSFLSGQLTDLAAAKENLEKVIGELDAQIKNKFAVSFEQIAQNFSRYFGILFSGGKAELKSGSDGAIEIFAKPPGKKIDNINALSGGERTLTSLSLIAAILDINPSPFIVLDEVDAALDEANTERFLEIVKELSKKSQFIAITHNRNTMKIADLLYGVTMDENHVSSLLSIRLEEAGKA